MKLGVLNHNNAREIFFSTSDKAVINIGDYVQSYGVENAYHKLGYTDNDIVKIEKFHVQKYQGEKLLVTMNNVYSGSGVNGSLNCFPTPEDIIPLFIGINCHDEDIVMNNISYFKNWEPIGCRDEKTYHIFMKYGIDSYISGCSSILFSKRKENSKQSRVFLVNTPEKILDYMPPEIAEKSEFLSQYLYLKNFKENSDDSLFFYNYGLNLLKKYAREAQLVITSNLHCLSPCLSMGIPVILVKDNIDYRFSWIDKFCRLYDCNNYSEIDWNCKGMDIEEAKKLLIDVYRDRVNDLVNRTKTSGKSIKNIHNFYLDRKRSDYNGEIVKKIVRKTNHIQKNKINILIWGAGRTGGLVFDEIEKNYEHINVQAFIDTFKRGIFKDKPVISPQNINLYDYDFIFLCSLPGKESALECMKQLNKQEEVDYCQIYFEPSELGG